MEGTWNTMFVIDIVIIIAGAYFLYLAIRMQVTKKVSNFVVPQEELNKCKDMEGFAEFLAAKQIIFAVVMMLAGILMLVNEAFIELGAAYYAVVAAMALNIILYYVHLTNGRNEYC